MNTEFISQARMAAAVGTGLGRQMRYSMSVHACNSIIKSERAILLVYHGNSLSGPAFGDSGRKLQAGVQHATAYILNTVL